MTRFANGHDIDPLVARGPGLRRVPRLRWMVVPPAPLRACGHIGCCDASPSQHASHHASDSRHPSIQSYEPGEEWFWDYAAERRSRDRPSPRQPSPARPAHSRTGRTRAAELAAIAALTRPRARADLTGGPRTRFERALSSNASSGHALGRRPADGDLTALGLAGSVPGRPERAGTRPPEQSGEAAAAARLGLPGREARTDGGFSPAARELLRRVLAPLESSGLAAGGHAPVG